MVQASKATELIKKYGLKKYKKKYAKKFDKILIIEKDDENN